MKIVVTYEKEDLIELIKKDLTNSGLKHDLSTGKWKGNARFTVEVEGQVSVEADAAPASTSEVTLAPKKTEAKEPPSKQPPKQDPPIDLDDVMARSQEHAKNKQGLYPTPTRTFMEGESEDWPGSPEPRGR